MRFLNTLSSPIALLLGLAVCTLSPAARADLDDDVVHTAAVWRTEGAVVREYPANLYERGESKLLLLPGEATSSRTPGCSTVAVLGAVSTSFVVSFARPRNASKQSGPEWPRISVAGVAEVTRCGDQRASLSRLRVEMRSPRAILQVVAARAPARLEALDDILPGRNPGPMAPPAASGPRPMPGPASARAKLIEAAASRAGAVSLKRALLHADGAGAGSEDLSLVEGCHRIDLLGPAVATSRRPPDIDAAIVDRASGAVLARDRTGSVDATLQFCVGERRQVELHFAGAPPRDTVVRLHARTLLPTGLPEYFGALSRARMAEALQKHHLRALGGSPVYESLGVVGVTALPVEVEPGACYVAAVAAIRGHSDGLGLAASVGPGEYENETTGTGTALAFCAEASDQALIEVEGNGQGLVWLAALWQTGRMPIGAVVP